ncbi:hypothetical protein [Pelagibius sp. 7325]|uniref:hypothetical protein n=1 Tax=Pelagibius sp. 7325 TaxID=3131994 RepID=UPI0030EE14D9
MPRKLRQLFCISPSEDIVNNQLEQSGLSKLILVSQDLQFLAHLRQEVSTIGVEFLSLSDLNLPEPQVYERDACLALKTKGAVISADTGLPAIVYGRYFVIDPLLRYGGGGPQWRWSVPWSGSEEDLVADIFEAEDTLNRNGYCGPDDRGALFQTLLCLVWPDSQSQIFEGRLEGQVAPLFHRRRLHDWPHRFEGCFVPNEEIAVTPTPISGLAAWSLDQAQAVCALRRSLETL